ncbi:MAG: TolC family protein [Pseudomonadota bacterium]
MASAFRSTALARRATTAIAASLVSACATDPLTIAPLPQPSDEDAAFAGAASPALTAETPPTEWWTGFGDPALTALVEQALRNSPTLRRADFDVVAAEAELRQIGLERTPSTSGQVNANFSEPAGRSEPAEWDIRGSLSASWEFDAWGRIASLIDSALATADGIEQARRDVAVTVASETALAYVDLRGAQRRLAVARQNAEAQAEGLTLIETLRDNGRGTQLDYDRAETVYRTTLASLPVFEADIDDATARLAALTGGFATESETLFSALLTEADAQVPALEGPLAVGSPAAMLQRRPDVRLAEAQLASAVALSEAVRADLFPRITLGATASGLFRPEANFGTEDGFNPGFSIGPAIQWSGPDLRRVYAAIDANDARAQALAAVYEDTVLTALSDAQVAISNYINERDRRADLIAAEASAQSAFVLASRRFEEGLDDYLDVLDAQRTRLDAEDRLALSELETARRAIRAYRSLGGIWETQELTAFRAG